MDCTRRVKIIIIDMIVNDYFMFKAITGAHAVNTDHMCKQNGGPNIQSDI